MKATGRAMAALTLAGAVLSLAHCGSSKPAKTAEPTIKTPTTAAKKKDDTSRLRGHLVAFVSRKSLGPFLARGTESALVGYITTSDDGAPVLATVSLAASTGQSAGAPQVATEVPAETTGLVLRALPSGRRFTAAWSALLDRGEVLSMATLNASGAIIGTPTEVVRTRDHIAWLDVVPDEQGSLLAWAEDAGGGQATILTAMLALDGSIRTQPTRVARAASGWNIVRTAKRTGLVIVSRSDKNPRGSSIGWLALDVAGRPASDVAWITSDAVLGSDVEVAPFEDGIALGWTDRSGEDPEVRVALVAADGKVKGIGNPLESTGGSKLLRLAPSPNGPIVLWQSTRGANANDRTVQLGRLQSDLSIRDIHAINIAPQNTPEIVGSPFGGAILTETSACTQASLEARECGPHTRVPSLVVFDRSLSPNEVHPLRLDPDGNYPTSTWGLDCSGGSCLFLTASSAQPTPVLALSIAPHKTPYLVEAKAGLSQQGQLKSLTTVASGDTYSELAAARVGPGIVLAAMTLSGTSRTRRGTRQGAKVVTFELDADGRTLAKEPQLITARAIPTGGLAIAPAPNVADGAAIAWIARDGGDPQVHVARVDSRGQRKNEIQLTTAQGDASDVTIAWVETGWVIAWVDSRDGNGEVYATKVDRDLNRIAREERITNAPGDASDIAMRVERDRIWLAWSDARESPREGTGDIYVTSIRPHDTKRMGDEYRVLSTAAHSRSPQFVSSADGAHLFWLEDAPSGLEAEQTHSYGLMQVAIDQAGKPASNPAKLPAGLGAVRAVRGSTANSSALFVAASDAEGASLEQIELGVERKSLIRFEGGSSIDTSIAPVDKLLFFTDAGKTPEERRIRCAILRSR